MRDAEEPTADSTDAHGGAVGVADGAPRLPEAVPAPTPPPDPAPDPAAEAAMVELEDPSPAEKRRAPVGFFVLMALIIGAIAAIAAVVRPWESSPEDPATVSVDEPAATAPSTAPATTQPAATTPSTEPPTTNAAVATLPTTTLVVAPLPQPESDVAAGASADAGPFDAAVEACATEQRTISVATEAYEVATGALPADPDALVASGMLREHPEGWSTRWTFGGDATDITVVPVAGGACDL